MNPSVSSSQHDSNLFIPAGDNNDECLGDVTFQITNVKYPLDNSTP